MKRTLVILISIIVFGCSPTKNINQEMVSTTAKSDTIEASKKAKLDGLFDTLEKNDKAMGTLVLLDNGKIVYTNSIGFSDVEKELTANDDTKYRVGSVTKMFTASLIMQMVEDGELTLDAKLSEYFPKIPNAEKITVEDLLRHRSGIYNFTNAEDYREWEQKKISKEDLVAKIIDYGSAFEPDTKTEYSNSNYVLLTFILEEISNKSFSTLIQTGICIPCGLNNTYIGQNISAEKDESYSYNKLTKWVKSSETDMSIPLGAGAMVSHPRDLVRFLNCLYVEKKIVSETSLKKMSEIEEGLGMGMFEIPFYGQKALGHTGGIDGFQANAFHFPEQNFSIAYCSNGVDYPLNDILIGVLSIYFDKEYQLPDFKTIELDATDLEKYLGIYSSPTFPLKITFTREGNQLMGQATGQSAFPLSAVDKDKFKFDAAGIEIEFTTDNEVMILRQAGQEFELKKE